MGGGSSKCEDAKNFFKCWGCSWAADQTAEGMTDWCRCCWCLGDRHCIGNSALDLNDGQKLPDGIGESCDIDLDCVFGHSCVRLPGDMGSLCIDTAKFDVDDFFRDVRRAGKQFSVPDAQQNLLGGNNAGNISDSYAASPMVASVLVAAVSVLAFAVGFKKINGHRVHSRGYETFPTEDTTL